MPSARIQLFHAIVLVASILVNVGAAFDSCLDPQTNEEIPVADLCAKYAPPGNDVVSSFHTRIHLKAWPELHSFLQSLR